MRQSKANKEDYCPVLDGKGAAKPTGTGPIHARYYTENPAACHLKVCGGLWWGVAGQEPGAAPESAPSDPATT
jgi:hypothetical protein